ncbi:MAG: presenilin family intramembrane aspartyl protease [Methanoregula sp.]|uniref:presenilin family intramembrane aspartyl protease PSH n=1 Tax=Methanoregula sp. TaxID=2052170 RepID=UPI0025F89491|nr:presenilin family intramembrane aspartyl protease PSH [Methanoregula sp.]MCK9630538.1 presenilin family intramembrane aspartyl protease [Methanoregula sp.]
MDTKNLIPLLAMPLLLLAVEIGAVLLSLPVQASGIVAFEDPGDMANPVYFIAILLVFTAFLLVLIKYDLKRIIGVVIGLSLFLTFCYIFAAIMYAALGATDLATIIALVIAILATVLLYKYPEWYIIDGLGILIGAGVAAIFGASLEVLPVLILLVLLAAYDAISVYKTKHMITLAEGVIDQKTPILFVIPKRKDYSFIKEGIGKLDDGGERAAFIIGMGDMIMPAILVVSANVFLQGSRLGGILNLPALGAIIGSVAGLAVLLHFVMSGKPQAGLPPICGGTILGFLVGWAAMGWV